jgi:predicted RecA/RadA family phage recombinase
MTKIRDGKSLLHTASGADIAKGEVVVLGNTIGVAAQAIADGSSGVVHLEGVFQVPKVSAAVFAVGEKLIYDVSASAFDDSSATPATGDVTGGAVAMVAGADTETTCIIKLTPGNTDVA